MLKPLLIAYLCLYGLFMLALFVGYAFVVPPQEKQDEKWWETPADIVMTALGFVGMILLVIEYDGLAVKHVWKVVSIALVVAQFYVNLKGRETHLRTAVAGDQPLVRFADVATLAFLAPSLVLNLVYAFGRAGQSAV